MKLIQLCPPQNELLIRNAAFIVFCVLHLKAVVSILTGLTKMSKWVNYLRILTESA